MTKWLAGNNFEEIIKNLMPQSPPACRRMVRITKKNLLNLRICPFRLILGWREFLRNVLNSSFMTVLFPRYFA